MPLVAPGLVATGVFCFIFSWSEFFFALTLTRSNAVPISVFIANFFGKGEIMWGQIASTSVVAMVPTFVVALVLQRYLVRGLTLGAIK
jgi:multiple sugar transport system permease protein